MIIILVIVKRKKQHMSIETEHVPHPNPYYKPDIKTDEYIKEELKDSADFGYVNHEPVYEPIDEEPSPYCIPSTYDVPHKLSERALPQRNSTGSALVQYENASTLKKSSTPHTSVSQYQNVADSCISPHALVSQYENVLESSLTPDGSKDKTDSAADLTDDNLQDVQPKNKDDAENSSEFSADEMADGCTPMKSINHEVDETTEGYAAMKKY